MGIFPVLQQYLHCKMWYHLHKPSKSWQPIDRCGSKSSNFSRTPCPSSRCVWSLLITMHHFFFFICASFHIPKSTNGFASFGNNIMAIVSSANAPHVCCTAKPMSTSFIRPRGIFLCCNGVSLLSLLRHPFGFWCAVFNTATRSTFSICIRFHATCPQVLLYRLN